MIEENLAFKKARGKNSLSISMGPLNCTIAMLKISKWSPFEISRKIHASMRYFSETSSKDLFEVLEEKIEEDIGYEQWFANTKEALNNSKGKFWLGKTTVSNLY